MLVINSYNYEKEIQLKINGLDEAEQFVINQQAAGWDYRWDGWDIVLFKPDRRGVRSVFGAYRNGQWGLEHRSVVDTDGAWEVGQYDARYITTSGN
jgi:Zn/Cd-binding protein ZinT